MKQKIFLLLNKLKSIKKRVWVILLLVLAGATYVYWNTLDYQKKLKFKANLGSREAKLALLQIKSQLGWGDIQSVCSAEEFSDSARPRIESAVKDILGDISESNYMIDELLGFSKLRSCGDYLRRREIQSVIDKVIEDTYRWDYSKLEERVFNYKRISKDRAPGTGLIHFYDRERERRRRMDDIIIKIGSYCEGEYEIECLSSLVRHILSPRVSDSQSFSEYTILERLIEITKGKEERLFAIDNQGARYLFAKALLKREHKNSSKYNKGFSMMNELANENYGKALLFLAEQYIYNYQPQLAKQYIDKAEEKKVGFYANRALVYHKLYSRYPKLYRWGEYDNDKRIWYLEQAEMHNEHRISNPEYHGYSLELAKLYLEEKKGYDKAKVIYENILNANDWLWNQDEYAYIGLGDIFYQGLGVRQDFKKAWEYYGKGCDLELQEACDKFREVNEKIH